MIRKNQKGFTLVELIIAVAILAIVTLAVCGFIVVGSKSYTSANTDIMLQQEAQLALNQISDVIIDTTDSITYSISTDSGMQNVLKDSEYGGEAIDKCLAVVNSNDTSSNNDNPSYWFYWNKDDEKIYFNEVPVDSGMDSGDIQAAFDSLSNDPNNQPVLAEHVTDLSIDLSQFEENRVVMISMTLKNGNREYFTSNNVTVRNKIALNVVDIAPMKRADRFVISAESVTLEPGDQHPLTATVDTTSSDTALKWKLESGPQNGTTIDENSGELTLGIGETRTNFNVIVSRMNEEYTGQNDRVSKTVTVNVKRANAVIIYGPDTAKQGETVDLTGKAGGNLLKHYCDRTECKSTDNLAEDEDLIAAEWTVIAGQAYAAILNPTKNSASLKIADNAPEGSKITVQAASKLADKKGYGPVTGTWTITVKKGDSKVKEMGSDFPFGWDQQVMNWLKQGMEYTASDYVIYARVHDPSGRMEDRWLVYSSNVGENMRFYPDMFGLELDRNYDLYMQAIVRVPMSVIKDSGRTYFNSTEYNVSQYDDLLRQVFADTSNFDSATGEYIGSQFYAGPYNHATISPPGIRRITCYDGSGKKYVFPGADEDYSVKYSLLMGGDTVINSIIMEGRAQDPTSESDNANLPEKYMTQMHLSVYKGEGNDINNWQFVAGYNPNTETTRGDFIGGNGMFYLNDLRTGKPDLVANNFFKRDTGKTDMAAAGTYHIVPGFVYANQEQITGEGRQYYFIYRSFEGQGDFSEHYYLQQDCAITVKVDKGLNLNVISSKAGNFSTYFPLPTDSEFPFALRNSTKQSTTWNFKKFDKSGNYLGDWNGVKVECEYFPDKDSYKITLSTDSINGKTITTHVYGAAVCKYGSNEWIWQDTSLEGDFTTTIVPNLSGNNGNSFDAYFPTPSDSDFPFKRESAQTQTIRQQLVLFDQWNNSRIITAEITCEYNNGVYTIVIKQYENEWWKPDIGTWKCASNGTKWN